MNRKSKINPITALYCRISIEDGNSNESLSISHQKTLLEEYAKSHGMTEYEFYVDDGYTGRNFNRPAFQQLIKDIESGKVNCVITKDLSRLGRNYIEAGSYIEVFFPRHKVRYIAVTDGVDSNKKEEMDITPFKNILNDLYSRDISRKVKTGWMIASGQGRFLGGPTPQGLIRDPDQKGRMIVDPLDGKIIRKMFDLALTGMGVFKIQREMNRLKIPNTYHKEKQVEGYLWEAGRISTALKNPFYKGAHIVCKTHQKGIRSKTRDRIPRDEWQIIEDCHEAIVSKEEWNRVQEIIGKHGKFQNIKKTEYENYFSGILYCADCGCHMSPRHEPHRTAVDRVTKKTREPIDYVVYSCSRYVKHGKHECGHHRIEARDICDVILADIKKHAEMAIENPKEFYDSMLKKIEGQNNDVGKDMSIELQKLKARTVELDKLFMSTYEDKAKGILSEKRFVQLSENIEGEQKDVLTRIADIESKLDAAGDNIKIVDRFTNEIRKCAEIDHLTSELVHRLIDRIEVGQVEEVGGEHIQRLKVVYSFVGDISLDFQSESVNGNYRRKTIQIAPE